MPRPRSHSISAGTILAAAAEFGFEMIPTVLMVGIEQELLVSFGAEDGTFHHAGFESEFAYRPRDPLASSLVDGGIAHDAAFAHLAPAGFKLRFD
jgi:hypothetical protein